MYKSELHSILIRALERSKWTRSTKDEDNFRQVVCAHLYTDISPNNTEIPSTRSAAGDIRIFGRKIELKYVNSDKRDSLDAILADIDLLLESKVEFCVVALRLDVENREEHLVHTVTLPLLKVKGAIAPIADHAFGQSSYFGPGVFLPACYPHGIVRISVNENGKSQSTNSYLSIEKAQNLERSSFLTVGSCNLHVDVIGSREDGLLILVYSRADGVEIKSKGVAKDIVVPYSPAPIRIASIERVDVFSKPELVDRKALILEADVARIVI